MNNLYDSLLYNWERGFYSVVKDKWDDYYVVSTKSFSGAFFVTEPHIAIDAAKHQVGNSKEYQDYLLDQMADAKNGGWKILENETFHPSELMGKGFQVGDKVTIPTSKEPEDVYEITDTYGRGEYSISCIKHEDHCHDVYHQVLKPVLPVEEKEHDYSLQRYSHTCDCGQWDSQLDKNNIDTLYAANFAVLGISSCNGQYVLCPRCKQKVRKNAEYQAIKVLTESGLITDGKIVNF